MQSRTGAPLAVFGSMQVALLVFRPSFSRPMRSLVPPAPKSTVSVPAFAVVYPVAASASTRIS
jgi:hypothetical protein